MIDLQDYKTIFFDCDGVILDSNRIKTSAFFKVAKDFGHPEIEENAEKLAAFQIENPSLNRFEIFDHLKIIWSF